MAKNKSSSSKGAGIKVGKISKIKGDVNIAGRDIHKSQTTTGLSVADIKLLFDHIYSTIETNEKIPPANKEDLKAEVGEIQSTITEVTKKNEKVDESILLRRFRNIARMAPDILDVVTATLVNPLAGLGIAVKKIAEKAKEETRAS